MNYYLTKDFNSCDTKDIHKLSKNISKDVACKHNKLISYTKSKQIPLDAYEKICNLLDIPYNPILSDADQCSECKDAQRKIEEQRDIENRMRVNEKQELRYLKTSLEKCTKKYNVCY